MTSKNETDALKGRIEELERENRILHLQNAHMQTAARRSSLYSESKDRLIEVITAEKSKQEKFMDRLLKYSPDIILTLDRDYRFVNCTDVFLRLANIAGFGLIRNATLFEVFDAFAPEAAKKMRALLEHAGDDGETVLMSEVLDIGRDGNARHYEIHMTKTFEGGERDGAILLLIDITDVIRAKEELEAVNAAMRDLTANMSHDLRTPLTIMSVHLEELCEATRRAADDELDAKANAAWRKNLDLQRLTQNLFEVSRIETGRSVYNPEWVPLSALMMRVQDRYEDFLDGRGLYLDIGYGEDAYLWLDERKIWSVFDNIVYNAVRYTQSGGISVTAETSAETATVTVRDTGSGIAPADLPRIFERFYKVESARGGASGDSGLGLYIVKSVMESLEGDAAAESEPGEGTAIVLTFKKIPIPPTAPEE